MNLERKHDGWYLITRRGRYNVAGLIFAHLFMVACLYLFIHVLIASLGG